MNVPKLRFKDDDGREFTEWKKVCFGDIATFLKGKGISKADIALDGITPCIRYGELYTEYGETIQEIKSRTNVSPNELQLSESNDVIIPASGETQLDIATAACVLHDGIALGSDLNIIKSKENGVFVSYYLNHQKKIDIAKLAQGNSVVHLYSSQLKLLDLIIPSKSEQTKIANFLTAIDEKISQLTQKHDLLKQYKKGVMQQIFSQKLRFRDDDGGEFPEWKTQKLGNFISEFKESSEYNNQYEVLTSSRRGLVIQKDYFGKNRLTERDNTGFNIIPHGYLTYRSRSDDGKFTFNINNLGITGVISTYYPVFNMQNGNNNFFAELFSFHSHIFRVYSAGSSQLVLSISELKRVNFLIPSLPEQTKIANFLTAIDDKITHTQTQLEAVKQYKKGLLQQMFV